MTSVLTELIALTCATSILDVPCLVWMLLRHIVLSCRWCYLARGCPVVLVLLPLLPLVLLLMIVLLHRLHIL